MFIPEYSCDDFMMLWLFTYIVCAKVFNEFSRKLCPFHCWQMNIKKESATEWIVSYHVVSKEPTKTFLMEYIIFIYI